MWYPREIAFHATLVIVLSSFMWKGEIKENGTVLLSVSSDYKSFWYEINCHLLNCHDQIFMSVLAINSLKILLILTVKGNRCVIFMWFFFIGRFNLLRTVLEKNVPCMCFKQRVWLVKQSCKPRSWSLLLTRTIYKETSLFRLLLLFDIAHKHKNKIMIV